MVKKTMLTSHLVGQALDDFESFNRLLAYPRSNRDHLPSSLRDGGMSIVSVGQQSAEDKDPGFTTPKVPRSFRHPIFLRVSWWAVPYRTLSHHGICAWQNRQCYYM